MDSTATVESILVRNFRIKLIVTYADLKAPSQSPKRLHNLTWRQVIFLRVVSAVSLSFAGLTIIWIPYRLDSS